MATNRSRTTLTGMVVALAVTACTPEPPEQGVERGEALFDTCVPCHGSAGEGKQELGAPAIAGLPEWYLVNQLRAFENNWRGAHPMDTVGIRMKSMVLALDLEGDLESVAAYVATMPATAPDDAFAAGDLAAGEAGYAVCSACHGVDGTGNEALNAPPLVGLSDWYLESQLRKFKQGWRGAADGDVWGATMRPNSINLDAQAMRDIVSYIETLQQ